MPRTKQNKNKDLASSLLTLRRSKDNINIRNVRASHLKYMLIFPLAPVFANMQRYFIKQIYRKLKVNSKVELLLRYFDFR